MLKLPVLIRQWGPPSVLPTLHFPLYIALHLTPSISFLNLHISVIQISFFLLLILFQSPCLHFDPSLHPLSSLCNLHIFVFYALFSIFTFLPLRWLHSATSCLRSCREHIKWCTLANLAGQHASRLNRAKRATYMSVCCSSGGHEGWQQWKNMQSLCTAHSLSVMQSNSYTHVYAHCQQTLQTTTQPSDVCPYEPYTGVGHSPTIV